jgi:putative acyl-CoA dehydrogenase
MADRSRFDTHEVFNQSPPYENVDLFTSDAPLGDAVRANGGAGDMEVLSEFGKAWGTAECFALARQANENPPKLKTFDPKGFRSDSVEFHPAYHGFMRDSMAAGLHASTWTESGARAAAPAEVLRAARFYMAAQVETGHLCPLTMTRAALAPLAFAPGLLVKMAPQLASAATIPRSGRGGRSLA